MDRAWLGRRCLQPLNSVAAPALAEKLVLVAASRDIASRTSGIESRRPAESAGNPRDCRTDPVVQREPALGDRSVLRFVPRRSELFEVAVDLATDFLKDGRIILSKFINRAICFGNVAFKNIADRSEGHGLPAKHEF
jgi:hypothetical protein